MTLGDLVPWTRKEPSSLAHRTRDANRMGASEMSPFMRLHQEMNRLFDDAWRSFDSPLDLTSTWPSVEVRETDNDYRVRAELPGLDDKDVELSFDDGVLTIRGEKREDSRDEARGYSEHFYGRFERRIALGDVDEEKAEARFDKGVLTVTLPKSADAQDRVKRIPINGAGAVH